MKTLLLKQRQGRLALCLVSSSMAWAVSGMLLFLHLSWWLRMTHICFLLRSNNNDEEQETMQLPPLIRRVDVDDDDDDDRTIIIHQNNNNNSSHHRHVCFEHLRELYRMHDCFFQTMQGGRYPGEHEIEQQQCSYNNETVVAAPLFHTSFMFGQGFGRILQHGVKTCLLATLLHRPCAVDLLRDRYYNLRSYLTPGSYDWDRAAQIILESQHRVNISHALHQIPNGVEKGHGWEKPTKKKSEKTNKNNNNNNIDTVAVPEYDNVLGMVWGTEGPSAKAVQRHLDFWDGRNQVGNNHHKILLSPNFGDAWYAYGKEYISIGREWNKRYQNNNQQHNRGISSSDSDDFCSSNHMLTLLQNRMFVPTTLAHELHQERRAIVLQEGFEWKGLVATTNEGRIPHKYGAIHLRMFILNRDMYKMGVTKERVVEGLKECFKSLENDNNGKAIVDKWWLIADDVEVATYVTGELDNVYSYASLVASGKESGGKGGDTSAVNSNIVKEKAKGEHSGSAMRKKFGQEDLAPSVIDWMALHESYIALITHDSAYGETGARGNGKIRGATCGGQINNQGKPARSVSLFNIFNKDEEI